MNPANWTIARGLTPMMLLLLGALVLIDALWHPPRKAALLESYAGLGLGTSVLLLGLGALGVVARCLGPLTPTRYPGAWSMRGPRAWRTLLERAGWSGGLLALLVFLSPRILLAQVAENAWGSFSRSDRWVEELLPCLVGLLVATHALAAVGLLVSGDAEHRLTWLRLWSGAFQGLVLAPIALTIFADARDRLLDPFFVPFIPGTGALLPFFFLVCLMAFGIHIWRWTRC
jgi:hypothetical protein